MSKSEMGKSTKTKIEDSKKVDDRSEVLDSVKKEEVMTDTEWKERLLKIHDQQVKLEYKYEVVPPAITYTLPKQNMGVNEISLPNSDISSNGISRLYEENEIVSTEEYRFDKEKIELEKGVSVFPLTTGGMVSKKGEPDGGNAVVFFSPGGKMTLKPSNMDGVKEQDAELAMLHIIGIQHSSEQGDVNDVEISAYLREPLVFRTQGGYEVELDQGEYTKRANSKQGLLKFGSTKISYDNEILAEKFDVKMDEQGILMPSDKKELKQVVEKYSDTVLDDDALKAEFHFENEGEWLKTYYMIVIGDTSFYLKNPERRYGTLTAKSATAQFYGFSIELEGITAEDYNYIKAKNGKANVNGKEVKLSDVKVEDADNELKAENAEMVIEGFVTSMNHYKLVKDRGASYESAMVKTQLNFGKNVEKPEKTKKTAQNFVEFKLGSSSYMKESFQENTRSQNIGASKKLEVTDAVEGITRESSVFEEDIYTLDGFAKLEDPEFEFVKNGNQRAEVEGRGKVKFLKIPYTLTMKDDTTISGEANGKDAVEDVKFHIDSIGNLDAEFEDDAEVILNLNHTANKENETENIIRTFTLGNLSIEKGYVNVGSLRMDRGFSIEQEGFDKSEESGESFSEKAQKKLGMDEKLLKIFNCKLSGTVATKSEEVQMHTFGIEAKMQKSTFGTYKTEDFMGFLSGEIDYPNGKLAVSAKKEVETENPEASFFYFKGQNLAESVSIPIGIPGVSVKFGLKPSASIGGEVGFSVERGKAFDEKWENQDELKLNGEVKTEGKAAIAAEAGIELGVPILANIDFKVGGDIGAQIEGGLEGETKFQYTDKNEKLQQSDDFEFKGKLGGLLKGALNLTSNVKFLFWNAQLFSFELLKKELGKLEFSGEGAKAHTQKNLTKGWSIKSGEFNAQWFSKEIGKKYRNEKAESVKANASEELKKLVVDSGKETEEAWAVLCELKEKRKNTLIILSEADKNALDIKIETITQEVMKKVEQYIILLEESEIALIQDEKAAQNEVEATAQQLKAYEKQEGISKDVFQKAEWGGFNQSNYQQEETNGSKAKMAAIDLMIARMLGEVSDENLKQIRDAYDEKNRNSIFSNNTFDAMSWADQKWEYEYETRFVHTGLSLYEDQSSFYGILNEKAIFSHKKYRNSYDHKGVVIKRTKRDFPKPFRGIVEKYPNITMKELLRCVLQNKEPDGTDLNATPEQKLKLLHDAFGFAEKITLDDMIFDNQDRINAANIIRDALAKKTGEKFADIFSVSLNAAVSGKSIINIFDEMKKLEENLSQAKMKLQDAQKILYTVQVSVQDIKSKKRDYGAKLLSLKQDSKKALKDKAFDAEAAKNVVDIYSNDYIDNMKKGQEISQNKNVQNVMSWAMANRKRLRIENQIVDKMNPNTAKDNLLLKSVRK